MSTELERQIFLHIKQVNSLIGENYAGLFDGCSATGVQFGVLRNIKPDGSTMTELRQAVSCAASNMTTLIKRMEREGLVQTRENPNDFRETRVHLTDYGKQAVITMEPFYRQFLSKLCGDLTEGEQVLLNQLLKRLLGAFA